MAEFTKAMQKKRVGWLLTHQLEVYSNLRYGRKASKHKMRVNGKIGNVHLWFIQGALINRRSTLSEWTWMGDGPFEGTWSWPCGVLFTGQSRNELPKHLIFVRYGVVKTQQWLISWLPYVWIWFDMCHGQATLLSGKQNKQGWSSGHKWALVYPT